MKFANVSNPTAFGVEWVGGDSGNRMQLVCARGTTSLMFGIRVDGRWSSTPVVAPERFMDRPPRTYREFVAIATSYVDA